MKLRLAFGEMLSLALLSLLLAFFFWVVATEAQDPMIERTYSSPLPVEIRNQPEGMVTYGMENAQVRLILRAPESLWSILQGQMGDIQPYVDLSGIESGTVTLPVQVEVRRRPVQVVKVSPAELTLTLEPVAQRDVPVEVRLEGSPALGFVTRSPVYAPSSVTIEGPQSFVSKTTQALIEVSVEEARETIRLNQQAVPVDEIGDSVERVDVIPRTVTVEVPVEQLGNIRDLAVHVVLAGQPAPGYRVGEIKREPPSVAVSGRRDVVKEMPGYLNTKPIELNEASESFTATVGFQTPEGLSVLTTPQVLVTVNIEPLESTLTVQLAPEIRNLRQGLTVTIEPETVQVIVKGPFARIAQLDATQVNAELNLLGLDAGRHTVPLEVRLPDESLRVEGILPQSSLVVTLKETRME